MTAATNTLHEQSPPEWRVPLSDTVHCTTTKPREDAMADLGCTALYTGRYLSMVARKGWEFVRRNKGCPGVGIVAITTSGEVVLVEQHRPPVNTNVIELPAGLCGDVAGAEDEALLEAAQRELLEETGYVAGRWRELLRGLSSPGLTDESITLFLAEQLERRGPGGGDRSEAITVHEVALDRVLDWLAGRGGNIDIKLLAGLFAAREHLQRRNRT